METTILIFVNFFSIFVKNSSDKWYERDDMGKRGPKPSGKFAKKGATLGARITAETRQRLDRAASASGRSVSAETEVRLARSFEDDASAEYHLLEILRLTINRVESFTGASWLTDRYTFELMVTTIDMVLEAFCPEEQAKLPDGHSLLRGLAQAPPALRNEVRAKIEALPPAAFAHSVGGGIIVALQQRGRGHSAIERELFEKAHAYLDGLLTNPILRPVDTEGESAATLPMERISPILKPTATKDKTK